MDHVSRIDQHLAEALRLTGELTPGDDDELVGMMYAQLELARRIRRAQGALRRLDDPDA